MVKIELSDKDANLFKEFMEHYDFIAVILKIKKAGIKSGQAIINFDGMGRPSSVEKRECLWRR